MIGRGLSATEVRVWVVCAGLFGVAAGWLRLGRALLAVEARASEGR